MKIENDFQKKVIDYLRRNKIWHFRFQAQSNKYGLPDIICLYRGFFLGLELKADKGSPTELQLRKLYHSGDFKFYIRSLGHRSTKIYKICF